MALQVLVRVSLTCYNQFKRGSVFVMLQDSLCSYLRPSEDLLRGDIYPSSKVNIDYVISNSHFLYTMQFIKEH